MHSSWAGMSIKCEIYRLISSMQREGECAEVEAGVTTGEQECS